MLGKSIFLACAMLSSAAKAGMFDAQKVVHEDKTLSGSYEDDDFDGLYQFLYEKNCNGPELVHCVSESTGHYTERVGNEAIQAYLRDIDACLFSSDCLNYHQILSYKNKLKGGNNRKEEPELVPQQNRQIHSTVSDLMLAEINYLCIKEALPEPNQAAR